jgi:hypothetical protein
MLMQGFLLLTITYSTTNKRANPGTDECSTCVTTKGLTCECADACAPCCTLFSLGASK